MNISSSFLEIIDDAKKWLEDTYYDQLMVNFGVVEPVRSNKKTPPIQKQNSLKSFYNVANLEKVEVLTFVLTEEPSELTLIEKMTEAIDSRIAKAKLIKIKEFEKNNLWEEFFLELKSVRHILISEIEFYKLPNLLKHYQEQPSPTLFKIPIFFLADLKAYNQNISLKKSLWQTLLSEL